MLNLYFFQKMFQELLLPSNYQKIEVTSIIYCSSEIILEYSRSVHHLSEFFPIWYQVHLSLEDFSLMKTHFLVILYFSYNMLQLQSFLFFQNIECNRIELYISSNKLGQYAQVPVMFACVVLLCYIYENKGSTHFDFFYVDSQFLSPQATQKFGIWGCGMILHNK